ncbi:MAG: ABC transporter ATP-binding protein [Bacteroidetes bacterium]|nr:MAG: ABC transporter ATP-binding protein [Bacteroidota bacterium]
MADSSAEQAVVTTDLTKIYSGFARKRTVHALDALSISVGRGEIFGLLGPNGAGKTTLLKILLAVVKPTSGEARLLGRTVTDWRSRSEIGFLPENHRFPPFLTAIGALRTYGELSNVSDSEIETRADRLLSRVGLSAWRDDRIKTFSKGMMQRLGIAQALLNDPAVLFLDEPTDGVDPIGRREIRDLLSELRDEGKTIFLNSHLLSEVELICDRVAILHKGRLIQSGTIEELTAGETGYVITLESESDGDAEGRLKSALPTALHTEYSVEKSVNGGSSDQFSISIGATTPEELNEWIDQLRNAGLFITAIRPRSISLETKFIQTITDRDDRAGIDAGGKITGAGAGA